MKFQKPANFRQRCGISDLKFSYVLSFGCSQRAGAFILVLVAASSWIPVSEAEDIIEQGHNVPARDRGYYLDASLPQIYGPPIPFRYLENEAAQELRNSQNPSNSEIQNIDIEQVLFLDLPADVPQVHEVHKRVLSEFIDDAASNEFLDRNQRQES